MLCAAQPALRGGEGKSESESEGEKGCLAENEAAVNPHALQGCQLRIKRRCRVKDDDAGRAVFEVELFEKRRHG
jgi:hypothetical protein